MNDLPKAKQIIASGSYKEWQWYTKKKNFKKHLMPKRTVKQLKKVLKKVKKHVKNR